MLINGRWRFLTRFFHSNNDHLIPLLGWGWHCGWFCSVLMSHMSDRWTRYGYISSYTRIIWRLDPASHRPFTHFRIPCSSLVRSLQRQQLFMCTHNFLQGPWYIFSPTNTTFTMRCNLNNGRIQMYYSPYFPSRIHKVHLILLMIRLWNSFN